MAVIAIAMTNGGAMTTTLRDSDLEDHARALRAYALRHVRDRALAEDLVQETLLAAVGGAEAGFAGRSTARTWLVGILKHKIIDSHRARLRRPLSLDELSDRDPAVAATDAARSAEEAPGEPLAAASDPETILARSQFVAACQRQLDRLSVKTSRAFVLSEVLGHDAAEVGALLGMSAGSVWTSVHRTRRVLREELAAQFAPA
jgi:RNA polymerase sigma-70 factor (ECF subfamily)